MSSAPYELYTLDGRYVGPATWEDVREFEWWTANTRIRYITRKGVRLQVRRVLESCRTTNH